MKILLPLLFTIAFQAFSQNEFIKRYSLMTDIGTKLFKSPIVVKAKSAVPLMVPSETTFRKEIVDTLYSNETAVLIKMIDNNPTLWVVKYKSRYRIMPFNEELFFFDNELYTKAVKSESTDVEKSKAKSAKKYDAKIDEMKRLVNKMEAIIEADKKIYESSIRLGVIEIGMPSHVVIASWGEPDRKTTSKKATGTFMIWYYTQRSSSVTFYNTKVYEITTSN